MVMYQRTDDLTGYNQRPGPVSDREGAKLSKMSNGRTTVSGYASNVRITVFLHRFILACRYQKKTVLIGKTFDLTGNTKVDTEDHYNFKLWGYGLPRKARSKKITWRSETPAAQGFFL